MASAPALLPESVALPESVRLSPLTAFEIVRMLAAAVFVPSYVLVAVTVIARSDDRHRARRTRRAYELPADAPLSVRPENDVIDSVPTFLLAKVALPERVSVSPLTSFEIVRMLAAAVLVPSYVRVAVTVTAKAADRYRATDVRSVCNCRPMLR